MGNVQEKLSGLKEVEMAKDVKKYVFRTSKNCVEGLN